MSPTGTGVIPTPIGTDLNPADGAVTTWFVPMGLVGYFQAVATMPDGSQVPSEMLGRRGGVIKEAPEISAYHCMYTPRRADSLRWRQPKATPTATYNPALFGNTTGALVVTATPNLGYIGPATTPIVPQAGAVTIVAGNTAA